MKFAGMIWVRPAQDRSKWYHLGEAFALQWADNGRDGDDECWSSAAPSIGFHGWANIGAVDIPILTQLWHANIGPI